MQLSHMNRTVYLSKKVFGKPIVYALCVFRTLTFHVCFAEEAKRTEFMDSIRTKNCNRSVSRSNLFNDLMQLYADEDIATEYPMFLDESAIDCGGFSRHALRVLGESLHEAL